MLFTLKCKRYHINYKGVESMDILWWQILLLTIYAGIQILDNLSFGFLAQPVMAGLITGLVMGM